jgi:hypothetical protein
MLHLLGHGNAWHSGHPLNDESSQRQATIQPVRVFRPSLMPCNTQNSGSASSETGNLLLISAFEAHDTEPQEAENAFQ